MEYHDNGHAQSELELLFKLREAEEAIKAGQEWTTLEELKKAIEE